MHTISRRVLDWEGDLAVGQQDSPLVEPESSHEIAGPERPSSNGRGKEIKAGNGL